MANTVIPPNFFGSDPLQRLVQLLQTIAQDILKAFPIVVVVGTTVILLIFTLLAIIFQDVSFAP